MRNAFINAVWQYHATRSSTPAEVEACKEMLEHIKSGDLEKAAIAAGKTVGSLAIWELALNNQEDKPSATNPTDDRCGIPQHQRPVQRQQPEGIQEKPGTLQTEPGQPERI